MKMFLAKKADVTSALSCLFAKRRPRAATRSREPFHVPELKTGTDHESFRKLVFEVALGTKVVGCVSDGVVGCLLSFGEASRQQVAIDLEEVVS